MLTESIIDSEWGNREPIQALKDYGVGIDTHSKFIAVCVLVKEGYNVIKYERDFPTSWKALKEARNWVVDVIRTKSVPTVLNIEPLHYSIESTGTYHLPVLKAFGGTPSVVNPLLASPSRRKTDKLDAKLLAYQNMTGLWPESFVISDKIQELRIIMRQRQFHQQMATSIANRINNYILRFGHTLGSIDSVTSIKSRALIEDMCDGHFIPSDYICPDGFPDEVKSVIKSMYADYDTHKEKAHEYTKQALKLAKAINWEIGEGRTISGKKLFAHFLTIPGIGEITTLIWLSQIVTPTRFKTAKQVAAYCGCDPSLKVSAGKVTAQTRRKGNQEIHYALVKCASALIQKHNEPLGQWGYGIYRRNLKGGWKKACSAVARRLAVAMFYVHKLGVDFSYEKYKFYEVPKVVLVPIEHMSLGRFEKCLKENGFSNSQDIAEAYYNGQLANAKGIGSRCLEVVRTWLDQNKLNQKGSE